jgi:alpha-1,3-rhamnosyl/mannosyltransferase
VSDRVVVLDGNVDDGTLPALYTGADLFVFPSLFEGFGLPPLEAMACGAPVACSHAASLPEVVGEAAVLFDPEDLASMVAAMRGALVDADLRARLRTAGLARSQCFSWEKSAQALHTTLQACR